MELAAAVDEFVADLEGLFDNSPSSANSVTTMDGHIVRLDCSLWNASPILRGHSISPFANYAVDSSKNTLTALLLAHREKIYPTDVTSLLNLLAVSVQLQLKAQSRECTERLFRTEEFWTSPYPPECLTEAVARCFMKVMDTPFRQKIFYRRELERLCIHCGNGESAMKTIMSVFKEKVYEYIALGLESLPIPFVKRSIPVAVINRVGKPQTAIFHDNSWLTVDLFGNNFDLATIQLDSFYLRYASYVIYKASKYVYRKSLRDKSDSLKVLDKCTFFMSREHYVFAVTRESQKHYISKWVEFDDSEGLFVAIYCSAIEIGSVDFDSENQLLVVWKKPDALAIFKLDENNLRLLRHFDQKLEWAFLNISFLIMLGETMEEDTMVPQTVTLDLTAVTTAKLDTSGAGTSPAFLESGTFFSHSGEVFRMSSCGLEKISALGKQVTLSAEEYVASSELCLHV